MKHAAGFVIDHVERWIDLLVDAKDVGEDGCSKAKNMSDWNDWLVFDILGDLLLGRSFGLKEPGENPIRKVPHMMMKHVQMFYPVGISSFSPRIPPESQLTPKQIIQSPFVTFFIWAKPHGLDALLALVTPLEITAYFTFINDSVAQKIAQHKNRKQDDSSPKAMFDHLCAARDPSTGQPYTEDALRGEALMLIPAGSDTTSNTLSAFWFYLTSNPAAYTRLKSEIRTTFSSSSSDIVPGPRLSSCTYLHACIDETMRLDPAGPSEPPREILPGGATIDGEFYPAGTVVGCANWAMGRNERVFGDPGRFRPERYVVSEGTGVTVEEVNRIRGYWSAFLIGPTNCIGKSVAMTELALVIARTVFRVEMRGVEGEGEGKGKGKGWLGWGRDGGQYQVRDAYITVHEGPMVEVRRREGF